MSRESWSVMKRKRISHFEQVPSQHQTYLVITNMQTLWCCNKRWEDEKLKKLGSGKYFQAKKPIVYKQVENEGA